MLRKIAYAVFSFIVIFGFCGCPNLDLNFASFMAYTAQSLAGMASDTETYNGSTGSTGSSLSTMSVSSTEDPDQEGWVIVARTFATTTIRAQYRFLRENEEVILAQTLSELYAIADAEAKKMEFIETITSSKGQFNCTLTFTRDNVGQKGGYVDGTASGENSMGGTFSATLSDVRGKGDGSGILTGGTITATFTSAKGKTWSVTMTYSSDGSADGTITGPTRTATIHLNPDRTGYYEDADGRHELEPPVSAI